MLRWFIKNRVAAFGKKFDYDMSYVLELTDIDTSAVWAFWQAQKMGSYRRDLPAHVRAAVALTAVIAEDCGPCTQLGITMALAEGVTPKVLASIVRGDTSLMTDEVALGVNFTRAVLAHDPEADTHRDAIVARWGKKALVTASFAITMSRVYPTLKYALGYGKACQRVVVGTEQIVVRGAA